MLPVGPVNALIMKLVADGLSPAEIKTEIALFTAGPVRRHFVNKKRAARSKKNRQERIDRVVRERAVQLAARARGWFRIGRGR